jgi:hypothetical protein
MIIKHHPGLAKHFSMIMRKFEVMAGAMQHRYLGNVEKHIVLNTGNACICSFTEFLPFCLNIYYFSDFKDLTVADI